MDDEFFSTGGIKYGVVVSRDKKLRKKLGLSYFAQFRDDLFSS